MTAYFWLRLFFSICLILLRSSVAAHATALFIFGDSTVDVGNNNKLPTLPSLKADYEPYGRRFFGKPTGRFSDGRIIVDFIAGYAGLPFIPPYADDEADFSNGANFASGGAGILSETNSGLVIDLKTQVAQFLELHKSLTDKLGSLEVDQFFTEAVYFISIGSNDYLAGYLGNSTMQQLYQPEQYTAMNVGNLTEAISVLYSKGARKIFYLGLGNLGCLPLMRMLAKDLNGGCLEAGSALAQAHNMGMSIAMKSLQSQLPGLTVVHGHFFDFLRNRIEDPSRYGFKEAVTACCGSGLYGGIFSCGKQEYEVCSDANSWLWWDSYHPSEAFHEQCAQAMWGGLTDLISPVNLRQLFRSSSLSLCVNEEEGFFPSQDVFAQPGKSHSLY